MSYQIKWLQGGAFEMQINIHWHLLSQLPLQLCSVYADFCTTFTDDTMHAPPCTAATPSTLSRPPPAKAGAWDWAVARYPILQQERQEALPAVCSLDPCPSRLAGEAKNVHMLGLLMFTRVIMLLRSGGWSFQLRRDHLSQENRE